MDEKKDKESKVNWNAWQWVIFAVVIIGVLSFIDSDDKADYTECVDDCVYDLQDCTSYLDVIYYKYSAGYISQDKHDACVDELDACINYCEIDYE